MRIGFLLIFLGTILFAQDDSLMVNKKDPKKAFLYSLFPGMGQIYNGKWIKSAIIIGLEISSYINWRDNALKYNEYEKNNYPLRKHRYMEKRNKYTWWIWIIYFYAMIDAIVDAHLHPFDNIMDNPINTLEIKEK
tara:strand:- start:31 stop:435 length:405 start_codon:yes stop_codon:yes gene_type:complete